MQSTTFFVESSVNLLQGLIYCGCCGRVLSKKIAIDQQKKKQQVYHYFYCRTKFQNKDKCDFKMVQVDSTTEIVLTVIKTHIQTITALKSRVLELQKSKEYLIVKIYSNKWDRSEKFFPSN